MRVNDYLLNIFRVNCYELRDDGGRLSAGEASVVVINPDPQPKLLTFTDREDTDSPPFAGTKVDCFFSDEVNGLVLGSLETLDNVCFFSTILVGFRFGKPFNHNLVFSL